MSKISLKSSSVSNMGSCLSWMKRKKLPHRKITLAIFGLDNAGKTVTALGLQGEPLDMLAPTIGFNTIDFEYGRFEVTLFDLGGGKGIRGIWKDYYSEVYGSIFVLDSAESERFGEAKKVLLDMIENPKIAGKPLLVLANKQDKEGAADEIDIIEAISLEEIVNINKCPCRIEMCAAIKGQGKKLDKAIQSGFSWLMDSIDQDFEMINSRVEKDMEVQRKIEEEERKAKRERVRKIREEREKKEAEERAARGEPEKQDSDEEEGDVTDNPFKRVDVDELTRKEEELKAKKKADKEKEMKVENTNENSLTAGVLPPIKSPRNINQNDTDENKSNSHEISQDVIDTYTQKSPIHAPRTGSPIPSSPVKSRSAEFVEDEESDGEVRSSTGSSLSAGLVGMVPPPRRLTPLDGSADPIVEKKKKKKKRRIRRNQTAPLVEEDENGLKESESAPSLQLGWGTPTPPPSSNLNKNSYSIHSLQLEPVTEFKSENNTNLKEEAFTNSLGKWGLAEDLPELAADS